MNWSDVTVSLLVALVPGAARCDTAGDVAGSGTAQSATSESPPTADPAASENSAAPESARAPGNMPPTPSSPPTPTGPAAPSDPTQGDSPFAQSAEAPENVTGSLADMGPGGGQAARPSDEPAEVAPEPYSGSDSTDTYSDTDPSALTDFQPTLDPYGTWADDPTVGDVWVPSPDAVGSDFRPYVTAGHWTYDGDWIWASDYSWGWVPFHYGRWIFLDGRGWSWVPGRAYRGAWVAWAVDSALGYVGWEPAAPSFVWIHGIAIAWSGPQLGHRWAFTPRSAVFSAALATHVLMGAAAAPIVARMRLLVPTSPTIASPTAGPVPERLGYSVAQLPRPVGAAAAGIMRAVRFSRPSTALALGARPPSRSLQPPLAPTALSASPGLDVFAQSLQARSGTGAALGGATIGHSGNWPYPAVGGAGSGSGVGHPTSSRGDVRRR
jgi:hypothetical protein